MYTGVKGQSICKFCFCFKGNGSLNLGQILLAKSGKPNLAALFKG